MLPNAYRRPERQHDRKRRNRADGAVYPEHLHVAAGADDRQAERVGAVGSPTTISISVSGIEEIYPGYTPSFTGYVRDRRRE
jgi:hypothetical protein